VFSLPDVVHFFADKLAGLGGRRLPFALIFAGAVQGFLLGHMDFYPPPSWFAQ